MKCLVIINEFASYKSYTLTCKRFFDEFDKANIEYDVIKSGDVKVFVGNKNNISKYDFGLYLDKDKYLARLLENSGLRIFNKSKAIEVCDDKMLTHIELDKYDIPQPKTIPGVLCYTSHSSYSKETLDKIIETLGLPLVIKQSFGSLGKGVFLAKTYNEVKKYANKLIHVPHLFQQFIKTSYGIDYRIIVINHKMVACMQRKSDKDFRSNIELGGVGIKCELPKEYKQLAEKVSKVLDLDYCGVDLLIGENNKPLVCEVNSNAFFNSIEKVSNVNVASCYVKYMVEEVENENRKVK